MDLSQGYKIRDPEGMCFVTITVVGWIDVFTRAQYCDILIENLKYCQREKGLQVHAYVIMSNHVHLILSTVKIPLQDIIRDYKKYTAKKIIEAIDSPQESRREWMLK